MSRGWYQPRFGAECGFRSGNRGTRDPLSYQNNLAQDPRTDTRLQSILHHEVHLDPQEIGQVVLQREKGQEAWRVVKGYEHVEVAPGMLLPPHMGTKHAEGPDPETIRKVRELPSEPLQVTTELVILHDGILPP